MVTCIFNINFIILRTYLTDGGGNVNVFPQGIDEKHSYISEKAGGGQKFVSISTNSTRFSRLPKHLL